MDHIIKWQPELKVGNKIIDTQHKILFDLANDLNLAVNSRAEPKVIDTLFNVLTGYAFNHFKTEEKFMEGRDDFLQHSYEHYQLMKKLHDYILDYRNGREGDIDPGRFMEKWLFHHIEECDKLAFQNDLNNLSVYQEEVDSIEHFDQDLTDLRENKRIRYDDVTDDEITAHLYNASSLKNSIVSVIDISSGGLKVFSDQQHNVDDLLVLSCSIGRTFKMKEKMRVLYKDGNSYGLGFVSPSGETTDFLTQLYGAVGQS